MAFSDLTKKQKGLPNDEILAGLYALSRVIKSRETSYVESKPQFEDVEDFHQKIYGETKLVANPFFMNAYAQLSFITSGCKLGQCSFCTYGANKCELTPEDVRVGMTAFLERFEIYEEQTGKKVYSVLFDAVGSILDSREFSPECLDVLFECLDEFLAKKDYIEEIGFETHYQTLGSLDENGNYNASYALQKLIEFKRKYADKKAFVIELGFESANPEIRNNIVFKPIDTNICKEAIDLLHQNGISVDLNVMATLPFLTKKEQIQSSAESIIVNIPYTLLSLASFNSSLVRVSFITSCFVIAFIPPQLSFLLLQYRLQHFLVPVRQFSFRLQFRLFVLHTRFLPLMKQVCHRLRLFVLQVQRFLFQLVQPHLCRQHRF